MYEKLEKALSFLNSPEGKETIKRYVEKIKAEDQRLADRIERFHKIYKDRIDEVMQHLINKYESNQYRDKEYKLGYEPRETLYWFMFAYAKTYGKPCDDERYFNTFTGDAYYLGSYVIQIMHGQGSVIAIDKIK